MLFGLGVASVLIAVIWIGREFLKAPEQPALVQNNALSATLLDQPLPVPDFKLVDQYGKSFTRESLRKHWSFMFFGYTHCPDVCPTTINELVQTENQLKRYTDLEKPHYVFVSIDPERDTPTHLAQYMSYFHKDFLGVSGSEDQLRSLTKPLGIYYEKETADLDESNYAVKHSAAILLIDHEARVRALLSPPHDATVMVKDYRQILAQI